MLGIPDTRWQTKDDTAKTTWNSLNITFKLSLLSEIWCLISLYYDFTKIKRSLLLQGIIKETFYIIKWSFCIRIWKFSKNDDSHFTQDTDEVCDICKNMVGQARDTLQSNQTQVRY